MVARIIVGLLVAYSVYMTYRAFLIRDEQNKYKEKLEKLGQHSLENNVNNKTIEKEKKDIIGFRISFLISQLAFIIHLLFMHH